MTFEVLQVFVVMQGRISYSVVFFRRSVDNGCILVRKAREVNPIFLRIERLYESLFSQINPLCKWRQTHLPVLQLYSRKLSSSAHITI